MVSLSLTKIIKSLENNEDNRIIAIGDILDEGKNSYWLLMSY